MTSGVGRFVFVDSSAFFALFNTSDNWHQDALRIHQRLIGEQWRLVTSNWVVAETHALVLGRLGRDRAFAFLSQVDGDAASRQLILATVQGQDELKARDIIRRYDDKDFSLTDATRFAVMERLNIPYAFTFDRNFTQYGLDVLSAQT